MPILDWLIAECAPTAIAEGAWADLRRLPHPPSSLPDKMARAVQLYPCDVLFVHRDADDAGYEHRRAEIDAAVAEATAALDGTGAVAVIPIRELEA